MPRKPDPAPYEGNVALVVTIGTIAWAVAGIALLPFWNRLNDHGHLWWIGACACGVAFGLLGRRSVRKRDRRVGRAS